MQLHFHRNRDFLRNVYCSEARSRVLRDSCLIVRKNLNEALAQSTTFYTYFLSLFCAVFLRLMVTEGRTVLLGLGDPGIRTWKSTHPNELDVSRGGGCNACLKPAVIGWSRVQQLANRWLYVLSLTPGATVKSIQWVNENIYVINNVCDRVLVFGMVLCGRKTGFL